jgi:hypothetical protein
VQLGALRARGFVALGLAGLRCGLLLAAALGFLTLAGLGLATRLFLGEHARFFVGAPLRFFFQLQALPRLGLALLRLHALLFQPILFLRLLRALDVVLLALDFLLLPVDFFLLYARPLFEHAAIEVGLLAAHFDVDHARAALSRGDLELAL